MFGKETGKHGILENCAKKKMDIMGKKLSEKNDLITYQVLIPGIHQ